MTDVNRTRQHGNHKKRDVSVAAYEIDGAEIGAIVDGNGFISATDDFEQGILPKNALIIAVHTVVLEAFDALLTMDIGTTAGGTELDAAVDMATVAVVAGNTGISIPTGATVYAEFSAKPTQGRAKVVIEYVEYEQATGELTEFSATELES